MKKSQYSGLYGDYSSYSEEIDRLSRVIAALSRHVKKGSVRLDFSVVNDMNYYNGIVFVGFVQGVPEAAISLQVEAPARLMMMSAAAITVGIL